MRKWIKVILIILLIIILIIGSIGFYVYNKYSKEISIFRELKQETDVIFDKGVTGPDECSSLTRCASYCNSDKESCVQFCVDNPENELCDLAITKITSGDYDLDNLDLDNVDLDNINPEDFLDG